MLVALTAGVAAGCSGSTPPPLAPGSFIGCALGPTWPLPVAGGSLAVLSVEGTSCQYGVGLMTNVIAHLHSGIGTGAQPVQVAGWNCVSYDGNQTTCTRGRATVLAQYGLS